MPWRYVETDPMTDDAAPAVLAAFDAAQRARSGSVDCYLAGVRAWRQAHPDQSPEYASKQAVAVIQAARVSLRVPDA
jgi:hypothetical protein